VLAVAHTLGAGTDAATPWLRAIMLVTGAPILFLALLRWLPDLSSHPAPAPAPKTAPPPASSARPAEVTT
jgi:hypothetical protein